VTGFILSLVEIISTLLTGEKVPAVAKQVVTRRQKDISRLLREKKQLPKDVAKKRKKGK